MAVIRVQHTRLAELLVEPKLSRSKAERSPSEQATCKFFVPDHSVLGPKGSATIESIHGDGSSAVGSGIFNIRGLPSVGQLAT